MEQKPKTKCHLLVLLCISSVPMGHHLVESGAREDPPTWLAARAPGWDGGSEACDPRRGSSSLLAFPWPPLPKLPI